MGVYILHLPIRPLDTWDVCVKKTMLFVNFLVYYSVIKNFR